MKTKNVIVMFLFNIKFFITKLNCTKMYCYSVMPNHDSRSLICVYVVFTWSNFAVLDDLESSISSNCRISDQLFVKWSSAFFGNRLQVDCTETIKRKITIRFLRVLLQQFSFRYAKININYQLKVAILSTKCYLLIHHAIIFRHK